MLLFACTRFGRFVPMLGRVAARGLPRSVEWLRLCRPPALAAGGALPGNANRPLTSSVATTARSRQLHTDERATTRDRLATGCVLHRSGQKRAFSARLRATSHHLRTPSAVSRTMSCDLVETRMRIRPRESSLSHPFTAASCVPPASKRGATAPWLRSSLERRSRAACDRTSRRTQRTSTRDACDQLLPTTLRRRAPTSRSVIPGCAPLARRPTDAWRASRRPTHFGWSRFRLFEAGVFFPRRRPSSHPLTLPSPRSAYPSLGFRLPEETPPPTGREGLRARGRDHPLTTTRDGRRKY